MEFHRIHPKKFTQDILFLGIDKLERTDAEIAGHCLFVAKKVRDLRMLSPKYRALNSPPQVAADLGVDETGYRIVTNIGRDGQQSVRWLHFHLIGGRRMRWPPG